MGRKWETIDLLRQLSQLEKTFELRDNFAAYVKASWHVYEPNNPMVWGFHHDAICEHLQAAHEGKIRKLLIALPPRHSKSSLASVAYPSWVWITKPQTRFLNASYAMSLSLRDSQRCRQLIDSEWYQEHFGYAFTWLGDQNKLGRYENDKRGYRLSSSVEGAATGEGGDYIICVSGDTRIQTDQGSITIRDIVDRQLDASVLSYNHTLHRCEYQCIEAYEKNPGRRSYKIHFSTGESLQCTDTHPIYIKGSGYIQADKVKVGMYVYQNTNTSPLHTMRKSRTTQNITSKGASDVLRQAMFRRIPNKAWSMRSLRKSSQKNRGKAFLFAKVQGESSIRPQPSPLSREAAGAVWELSNYDRNLSERRRKTKVLQSHMRGCSAQGAYQGGKQSELYGWKWKEQVRERVSVGSKDGKVARWLPVHDMPQDTAEKWQAVRCTPYRLQQRQQQSGKLDSVVSIMSQSDTEQREYFGGLGEVSIVSVEEIAPLETVYNLRIKGNHNYFANGVLTHNCDDAHNIQESESDLIREQTLSWWDRVMTSRLNDQLTGRMIVIGQRVHEQDLIGHLLESGDWDYLCLPAEYESSKKSHTSIGWSDPRTEEGEALWPAKFPKDILEYLKRVLVTGYYAQYQQTPVRDSGNIFKSNYFQAYTEKDNFYVLHHLDGDRTIHKSRCRAVISTDLALSKSAESDYTVILTWAVTPQMDFLLLDIVCERMEAPEAEELVWSKARAVKRLWTVLVEDVAYQKSAIQRLRRGTPTVGKEKQRRGLPITAYHPTTDKVSRAQSLVVWMSAGNFYFNEMLHGFAEYKRQLLGFPRSGKDDMVDATTITNVLFELGEPQVTAYDDMIDQITQEEEALLEIYHENNELGLWLMEEDGIEYLPYG